jgi:hypothetical protein
MRAAFPMKKGAVVRAACPFETKQQVPHLSGCHPGRLQQTAASAGVTCDMEPSHLATQLARQAKFALEIIHSVLLFPFSK